MATIYQLRTFSDLYSAVMETIKLQSGDTVSKNRIKRDINTIYLNEVCPYSTWKWLRNFTQVGHEAAVTAGTCTVTADSTTVTFSTAPSPSKKGFLFKVDGFNEIYRIASHTAASTTLELESPYNSSTSSTATYKIWNDKIPLPTDLRETVEIYQHFIDEPLEGLGLQQFKRYVAAAPFAEGRPLYFSTTDYVDPVAYSAVTGLPSLSTRASSGLVRTLVFSSDVSALLSEGDRIEVTGAGTYQYNGEYIVASVSTTTATYVAKSYAQETATADASLTVKLLNTEASARRYRELLVYPSINNVRTTLNIDYIKEPFPLEEDSDEPLMPIGDRTVLLYGALMLAWGRERNTAEADRNAVLYQRKLEKMAGKVDDSTDLPVLKTSRTFLAAKRNIARARESKYGSGFGGGGSSATTVTGTASRLAVFNSSGVLEALAAVDTTEAGYLDGVSSALLGQSDSGTFTNKTIDADSNTITNIENADIKAAAGIVMSKLEALTASRALVSDGSGVVSVSAITSTEVTYLDDVEALTTFAMSDNQASAADVALWAHASFTAIVLDYSLSRGSGNREVGTIHITTDGTTAGIATSGASIGTLGVTFSVDINGTDLRLRYTSTSTGTAPSMKYKVNKWLA